MMELKTYMFHYIRNPSTNKFPYLNYFSEEKFINLLDSIPHEKIVSIDEKFLLEKKSKLLNGKILFTFDDALKEHHNFVLEQFIKRNILGIFFVPTKPFISNNQELLSVHKSHLLYGYLGWESYIKKFLNKLGLTYNEMEKQIENKDFKTAYPYDETKIAKFKYFINYVLELNLLNSINTFLIKEFIPPEFLDNFYLTKKELKNIYDSGMIIGAHGHNHVPLSSMSETDQYLDLKKSIHIIKSIIGKDINFISYPFGDLSSINKSTIKVVKELKFKFGFLAENVFLKNEYKFTIPRIDCVDI